MTDTWTIGGVPEHFNEPWYELAGRDAPGFTWRDCPGGTGEMCKALEDGELDLALVLTEGAVARIGRGTNFSIVGTFVPTPLQWGIHVDARGDMRTTDDLAGRRFGISRDGSGSHIMALVLADQRGWSHADDPQLVTVSNFEGARAAFTEGRIEGFLWERFMTKPMVDQGHWRRVGVCTAPWTSFVVVARHEIVGSEEARIHDLLDTLASVCAELSADEDALLERLDARHALGRDALATWLSGVRWAPEPSISRSSLEEAAQALVRANILPAPPAPEELVGAGCTIRDDEVC
ncbi:MAG: ABC transporter substrate-binding protein [Myxococcota bacterium]